MSKKTLFVVVALVVAVFAAFVVTSRMGTPRVLPEVTAQNAEHEVLASDKPVFVLVVAPGCKTCAPLLNELKAQAAKHPEMKFVQASAAELGVPAEAVPAALIVVPGLGPTYQKPNFTAPADFDAFINQRVDFAKQEMAAAKVIADIEKQIAEKGKPFDAEIADIDKRAADALAPLRAEAETVMKPFKEQSDDVKKRLTEALDPLREELRNAKTPDEKLAIQKKMQEKAAPLMEEIATIRAKAAEAMAPLEKRAEEMLAPFRKEAEAVEARRTEALGTLPDELAKAEAALKEIALKDLASQK